MTKHSSFTHWQSHWRVLEANPVCFECMSIGEIFVKINSYHFKAANCSSFHLISVHLLFQLTKLRRSVVYSLMDISGDDKWCVAFASFCHAGNGWRSCGWNGPRIVPAGCGACACDSHAPMPSHVIHFIQVQLDMSRVVDHCVSNLGYAWTCV